jgi:signal transduction histidine kinase
MVRSRFPFVYVAAAFVLLAIAVRADAAPRRVLLLYSYEREFSHYTFASLFRPELTRTSTEPIDFIEVALESVRARRPEPDGVLLNRLRGELGDEPVDLVVPIGGPAAAFAQKFRGQLFPDTPVLLTAVDSRFLQESALPGNETAVTVRNDPYRMVQSILQLLPDTRTVMIVIGASTPEQFWVAEARHALQPLAGRLSFIFTNELTVAELLARAGSLPPHAAVFYGIYSMDAAGVPQMEMPTLDALHAAANAPIFGLHSHQLGHGIVGGPLLSLDEVSRDTTAAALRLLHGESASTIQTRTVLAGTPVFDARELRRWRIPESRLPRGSVIRYDQPSFQERHPTLMMTVFAFLGVQTLLVAGLVITLVRRRGRPSPTPHANGAWDVSTAEAALARLTHRLMEAQEEERARIAATLHDDVCQQLTGLKMRLQSLGSEASPASGGLRTRIEDLCEQFGALEGRILALTDPVYARLEMLGLVVSARAYCQRLCQQNQIVLTFRAQGVPVRLCSRITLAVFRVLQEAMENAVTHAATPRIAVTLTTQNRRLELHVDDEGKGFDPDDAIRAGAVGLIDMRERLRLVGGTCTFVSRPGHGTRVVASVAI